MRPEPKELWQKWEVLCGRLGISEEYTKGGFRMLAVGYGEPHRRYHTFDHIRACLDVFESMRDLCEDPDMVELALWFHDLVYNTRAKDNEEKSAERLRTYARVTPIDVRRLDHACNMIMATKHGDLPHADADTQVLLDCDLSILGTDWQTYKVYAQAIRQEYGWVPTLFYKRTRRKIMTAFNAGQVFRTDRMCAQAEHQAHTNITRELIELL